MTGNPFWNNLVLYGIPICFIIGIIIGGINAFKGEAGKQERQDAMERHPAFDPNRFRS